VENVLLREAGPMLPVSEGKVPVRLRDERCTTDELLDEWLESGLGPVGFMHRGWNIWRGPTLARLELGLAVALDGDFVSSRSRSICF
jgi:hypothetical protein